MKTNIKNSFLLPALLASLGVISAAHVTAQTFTTLHSFTPTAPYTYRDGAYPYAGLITNSSGNTLYGTATGGGSSGNGTVFAINTDGTGFMNLHSFTALSPPNSGTNSDGASPQAGLILSGNTVYGTALHGGSSGNGTVFAVNTDGTGFTNLHTFTGVSGPNYANSDGANPYAGLILSGNTLYGTASRGGSSGNGTVFAINTDGAGFTNLHNFTAPSPPSYGTNSDGSYPYAGLILSGNTLYGTALGGGSSGNGTVFAINTDGTGFTNLHSFTDTSDGANPYIGLILSGNTLYGAARNGGSSGWGTVFALNPNGTGFTNLHNFAYFSDGANPVAGLTLSGNTLYGTASQGGSLGYGTVFAVNTDGTGFTNLHSFTAIPGYPNSTNSDGATPAAGLTLSGNTLYGTAPQGGSLGYGMVFAVNTDGTGFTNLHSFNGGASYYITDDGANPVAGLITNSSGNTLYGTTYRGGSSARGTVFTVNTDGTGFTTLHSFTATSPYPYITNSDGANPRAPLILSGNTLYGTAERGGNSDNGTLFAVNTDGTGFTNLHSFTGASDGANASAGLVLSGNTLYGTAHVGGNSGNGTVFAVNTDGTGFTNLHNFTARSAYPPYSNSDGAGPYAGLVLSGSTLYGTAYVGGSSGNGTVFAVNTDGTGFTNLHSFTATTSSCCYTDDLGGIVCYCSTNSDGYYPYAGLVLSGNTLYGTAVGGGSSANGTVFAINTDGSGFTNLHSFDYGEGIDPYAGLILSGNTLYGTLYVRTVFALNTDGTGFTKLHSFTGVSGPNNANSDGDLPMAGLILSGNTLYGTAFAGGSSGNGTVFSLSFAPQLSITPSGVPPSGIILSWPTSVAGFDYTGYTLQSATNLDSPVWSTNSPAPVVVNGQNTITNPISGAQKFYRLVQ